tara:strand:- start:150 stop:590 length:441 start_codon:yes stop_codon:yes gene_type:complete
MISSDVYIGIQINIDTIISYLNDDNWKFIKTEFLEENTTLVKDTNNLNNEFTTLFNENEDDITNLKSMKKFLNKCKKKGIHYFTSHSDDCKIMNIENCSLEESVETCNLNFNKLIENYFKCREYVTNILGIYDYKIVFINNLKKNS